MPTNKINSNNTNYTAAILAVKLVEYSIENTHLPVESLFTHGIKEILAQFWDFKNATCPKTKLSIKRFPQERLLRICYSTKNCFLLTPKAASLNFFLINPIST